MLCLCLLPSLLPADQIPLGLSWKEIYVQEYFNDGQPYFLIANLGKKDVLITTTEGGKWKVGAGKVVERKTTAGQPNDLVRFYSNGGSLGLVPVPIAPKQPVKDKIATYAGLNGSGGTYYDVYCVQKQLSFPSGGKIEIELIVPPKAGTMTFPKDKKHDYPITEVFITQIKCDSLPVTDNGKEIVINANQPLKEQKAHTAMLQFQAPKVDRRTLVMFSGWSARSGGGGHGITRGVVIVPAD
jgi:hypothetical protein